MNQMMGRMPTVKELWKEEPNKIRIWIVLFSITVFIFSIISLTGSFMNISNKTVFETDITQELMKKYLNQSASTIKQLAKTMVMWRYIITPFALGAVSLISITYFLSTLPQSYKKNTFANLSQYPINACYSTAFIGILSFWWLYDSMSIIKTHPGAILIIVSSSLSLIILFFTSRVGTIRKIFKRAKAYEDLQNSPEFQQMQAQMQQFFNQANSGQTPSSPFANVKPQSNVTPADVKKNEESEISEESNEIKELKKLNSKELLEIASKLSISGAEKMSKEDLMNSIIRITKGNK